MIKRKEITMIEQILLQQTEREMEKRYQEHLEEQLEECKRITIQRNAEKQKEAEQNRRLNNFFEALTNFMED